ncbi:MAG: phenylalanine--tRNA ligase subunit beta, partial [Candidatus Magasanikbacteria bacterium]
KLTLSTVEIEDYQNQSKKLEKMVVGKIKEIKDHPNADNLEICMTDTGDEAVQIICGGSNIEKDLKVAVAKVGAKVRWHGEGDLVELEETEIRGEKSKGMIAAANEIGLEDRFPMEDEKEILDLSSIEAEVGTPLAEALNQDDIIFEIDNKSMTQRPDLWGHYGLARELSVIFDNELEEYNLNSIESDNQSDIEVQVKDSDLCPRYMALEVSGVEVEESPQWLQDRLRAVDIDPVNNIVDITNYVMMELGQPMHAFDKEKISSDKICVRTAKEGESIKALDQKEYELKEEDLVIADSDKPIALAGIIGAENSEVDSETREVVFESANFERTRIRRSSMRLGVRTDSSARFEKGLDPTQTVLALKRAVELLQEVCPQAEISSEVIDRSDFQLDQGPIEISLGYIQAKTGVDIDPGQVENILTELGFEVEKSGGAFSVRVPTWRATVDINSKEDLIEEIARIYGYNEIEPELPRLSIDSPYIDPTTSLKGRIRNILNNRAGLTETKNYSFVSAEAIKNLDKDPQNYIKLKNPIAKDKPYLRENLFTNVLENIEENLDRFDEVALFELGKTFDLEKDGPSLTLDPKESLSKQEEKLTICYSSKEDEKPFFSVKSAFEDLLEGLNISCKYKKENPDWNIFHPGRFARVISDEEFGFISEIHPKTADEFDIEERVGFLEVSVEKLKEVNKEDIYDPVPEYPAVERDLAFIVGEEIEHQSIVNTIKNTNDLIESVELFDIYKGENIEEGKKNLAYHIYYRSPERTLNSKEVDEIHSQVESNLSDEFNADIREE